MTLQRGWRRLPLHAIPQLRDESKIPQEIPTEMILNQQVANKAGLQNACTYVPTNARD